MHGKVVKQINKMKITITGQGKPYPMYHVYNTEGHEVYNSLSYEEVVKYCQGQGTPKGSKELYLAGLNVPEGNKKVFGFVRPSSTNLPYITYKPANLYVVGANAALYKYKAKQNKLVKVPDKHFEQSGNLQPDTIDLSLMQQSLIEQVIQSKTTLLK